MSRTTISVSLCTFNGERFLPAQLRSILEQDRLPDEVVICDDRSTDRSIEIAREFAKQAPFPVQICVNEANLGSNRNFEKAVGLCTGDLIALSDQDDIWTPARLRFSEAALMSSPACGLVFGDGIVIDDDGRATGVTLWENFAFTPALRAFIRKGNYVPFARFRFVTGATVMFRSSYRPYLFPILGEWVHDGWIAMLIACMSGICFIEQPLIHYRLHAGQQIGFGNIKTRQSRSLRETAARHWAGIDAHRISLESVISAFDRIPIHAGHGAAQDFAWQHSFLDARLSLPKSKATRLLRLLRLRRDYSRGANGWFSIAKDLILPKRPNERGAAKEQGFSLFNKTGVVA